MDECTMLDISPKKVNQKCQVKCLYNLNSLQEECAKRHLLFSKDIPKKNITFDMSHQKKDILSKKRKQNEYEVERIVDRVCLMGEEFFLIKWRGWGEEYNSWEPRGNLNCTALIKKFKNEVKNLSDLTSISKEEPVSKFSLITSYSELTPFSKLHFNGKFFNISDRSTITKYIKDLPLLSPELLDKKREIQRALRVWEAEINRLCNDPAPIVVENDVDMEGPPQNFHYINEYKAADGINIPDDPLIGCECEDCSISKKKCCGHQSGSQFAYNRWRRVKIPQGSPIYECNNRCKCDSNCINRVVQFGRKFKLSIFRTNNGCGWGVKALEKIKKDSFVMEYVGEVITSEEAERRGKKYDAEGRTYLFDLDYNDGDCPFTVDAAYYGNVSHFMNHSCEPNLVVYGVWINTLDPSLPRIAFFSTKDIKIGEELTFDYMMTGDTTGQNKSPTLSPGKNMSFSNPGINRSSLQASPNGLKEKISFQQRIRCKCLATNCRKFLF